MLDNGDYKVINFNRVDVFAALEQSARIAEREGFAEVAERCRNMATLIREGVPANQKILLVI